MENDNFDHKPRTVTEEVLFGDQKKHGTYDVEPIGFAGAIIIDYKNQRVIYRTSKPRFIKEGENPEEVRDEYL